MTADELIAKLRDLYPVFEHAAITINPITEHSTSTMFGRLLGNAGVRIECKGKTAEEIEAELEALLAAQGVNNPNILVIKPEENGKTRIKICVPTEGCGK
jgi:predicted regulator of amino acid metabolism with ACT domain